MQASLRDFMRISIHALREEGDVSSDGQLTRPPIFLSTPSARRATTQVRGTEIRSEISIHALREEGDVCFAHMIFRLLVISIHALREEGDATRETVDDEEDISIHALREEGDVSLRFAVTVKRHFYPRPPRGGRPPFLICGRRAMSHFYPRPPRGGRPSQLTAALPGRAFLSTPSARRATPSMSQHNIGRIFLSTPSARRATIDEYKAHKKAEISIHALREEGDREIQTDRAWRANFYPRPPRGGRPNPPVWVELISGFLSTPSARRATSQVEMARRINKDFYPRPPRGGRRETFWGRLRRRVFLSTPSARRATRHFRRVIVGADISIHALREEGDRCRPPWQCRGSYFYPRPPRGGRPMPGYCGYFSNRFLSTPSARRATLPRGGKFRHRRHFYPHPPRGGRPLDSWHYGDNYTISIHALREEGDIDVHVTVIHDRISIHALREEGDRSWSTLTRCPSNFYPRPPRGGRHVHIMFKLTETKFLSTPSARRATC